MKSLKEIEKNLDNRKIKAAQLLVENEFAPRADKRTHEEIAEEVGISRQSLFKWRREPLLIKYMEALSDISLASYRSRVDSQLMKLIEGASNNGNASIKAVELWYKLNNRLVERSEVIEASTPETTRTYSDSEMQREVDEINDMMKKH